MRDTTYVSFTSVTRKINEAAGDISILTSLKFRRTLIDNLKEVDSPAHWLQAFIPLAVKKTPYSAEHLLNILRSAINRIINEPPNFRNKFSPDEKKLARSLSEAIQSLPANAFPVETQHATSQPRSTYGRRPLQPTLFQLPQPEQKNNSNVAPSIDPSLRDALAMFRSTFPGATT